MDAEKIDGLKDYKELEANTKQAGGSGLNLPPNFGCCPSCGRCPTCGRPYGHWNYPYQPHNPYYLPQPWC